MALSPAATAASQRLASDPTALAGLKTRAAQDPKGAAREAATLLEGLFLQQMLKQMRAASLDSGLDNQGAKLGTDMLDSQLATQLAGKPGGLADIVARQLERQFSALPGDVLDSAKPIPAPATAPATAPAPSPAPAVAPASTPAPDSLTPRIPDRKAAAFVERYSAAAQAVARQSGIPASLMLAQAGHETGWGQHPIKGPDGTLSNNLFGIKAGAAWRGATVDLLTTEFKDGQAQKVVQRFRAYASPAESFADYAQMLSTSPRYQGVVQAAKVAGADPQQFAQGLQKAGYATDPAYAQKLGRAINLTLALQRASGGAVA